jgi:transcriptional regulator with XRE-family HTH domain
VELDQVVRMRLRSQLLGPTGRGRRLRQEAGLSVRELARFLGVKASTLTRWETGQTHPRGEAGVRWVATCHAIEEELSLYEQEVATG